MPDFVGEPTSLEFARFGYWHLADVEEPVLNVRY